ncbi:MAG: hypothetical protein N2253_02270 [Bacteroidia bacterium]|nr:hypothetical protein [Bacteroidia bacterium]MCX7763701.1 hypothetical protein [Bacteroidia bacterium]MDW8058062.1 hypothetical protein [Bacteroidia bacterium]
MSGAKLSSDELWEIIQQLTEGEYRQVSVLLRNQKEKWLLAQLRRMKEYDETQLRKSYQKTFPRSPATNLRTYKYNLWDTLGALLPAIALPELQMERRIWEKLWFSIFLWQRGLSKTAFTLWHQAVSKAIELGWEEVALWGLQVLETYMRDFHSLAQNASISQWGSALLQRVHHRYQALIEKLSAMEHHIVSRQKGGISLPEIPSEESWVQYFEIYARLLRTSEGLDMKSTFEHLLDLVSILVQAPTPTSLYVSNRLLLNYLAIGVPLLHLAEPELFEHWYRGWMHLQEKNPSAPKLKELHATALTLYLTFLLRWGRWNEASSLCLSSYDIFAEYVLLSDYNLMARPLCANAVYLSLILTPGAEAQARKWYIQIDPWMEEKVRHESIFLRWRFLRWYAAFREGSPRQIQYWYRKLRETWRENPVLALFSWRAVLRALRGLTPEAYGFQKRRLELLLRRWNKHPSEKHFWEAIESLFFPLPLFIHSILKNKPLESSTPDNSTLPKLEDTTRVRAQQFFTHLVSS